MVRRGSTVRWVVVILLAVVALALVIATLSSGPTASADPSVLYADFSADGKLSCKYSRADLHAALAGAAVSQYGDPYTVRRFTRAVNAQLAPGGCARSSSSSGLWWTSTAVGRPAPIVFLVRRGGAQGARD